MSPRQLDEEIRIELDRVLSVVLPPGVDLGSREGKLALDAALRTRVAAHMKAEAKAEERKREKEREQHSDPLMRASFASPSEDDDEEIVDLDALGGDADSDGRADDEADDDEDVRSSAFARYIKPKKRPVGSPLERYFAQKPKG